MPRGTRERRRRERRAEPTRPAEGSGTVTTTIALDEETHRRLRHLAVEEKTSLRELIRAAIAEFLAHRKER